MTFTAAQHSLLMQPIKSGRITQRSASGKMLSYLESWDVRAHLIRVFGFGGFDLEMISSEYLGLREYKSKSDQPMTEPMWFAMMRLRIKDKDGFTLAVYTEGAVGSASGPANMLGEQHDNALKTAASDAMKRCAINLGSQFGLSLYDKGNRNDVVKKSLVVPEGAEGGAPAPTAAQIEALQQSIGVVTPSEEPTPEEPSESEDSERPGEVVPELLKVAEALGATEVTTEYTDAQLTSRRRHMFALFNEAGFPKGSTAEARDTRLKYISDRTGTEIKSSNDMTYEQMTKVIEALTVDIEEAKP